MASSYHSHNESQRERLTLLAGRLTEDDLDLTVEGGWSVAAALVHIAFWDEYCVTLLERWRREGFAPTRTAVDAVNAAVARLAASIPAAMVPELVIEAACKADDAVEQVPDDLISDIESGGYQRMLDRGSHRRHHLDAVERALAG